MELKQQILSLMSNEDLTNELATRRENNTIDIDYLCQVVNCSQIEYLEACLEGMDTDQLKAFEKTFEKIYEKQQAREEEDYQNHKDYKSTMEHLDKIFRI
jgi:hypothetical protein